MRRRCGYIRYHDEEWGVPSHDDRHLFEMLILEGAQAGLSWLTILRKRAHYRRGFHNFDAARVAGFTEAEIAAAVLDPGIVRNRLKVRAAVLNAQGTLAIREGPAPARIQVRGDDDLSRLHAGRRPAE